MNKCQKIIGAALCSLIFHTTLSAMQQRDMHRDDFLNSTTTLALQQLADLFPNAPNLQSILPMLAGFANPGTITGAINTAGLPGNPPSSGVPLTDIQTVTAVINPGSPDLGTAVSSAITLAGSPSLTPPVGHTTLIGDLTAVKTAIGPGANMGASVSADLTLIGTANLNPGVPSSDVINTDLGVIASKINATPNLTLGAAITADLTLIGLGGGSSGVIGTDLGTELTAIGPGASIQAAILYDIAYINTAGLPGNPGTSHIIANDLTTAKNTINNSGLVLSLGSAIGSTFTLLGTGSLNPAIPTSNIINTDLGVLLGQMSTASPTFGGVIASLFQLISTSGLSPTVPSTVVISNDIRTIILTINPTGTSLGGSVTTVQNLIKPATPLLTGITAVNTILGPGTTADADSKATNLLTRLNTVSTQGLNIAANGAWVPLLSIDAWLKHYNF